MKTIVAHLSPDLDAISAAWLLKRFRPDWAEAELAFVPAGTTLDGQVVDSDPDIAHVDTGLGQFDHHQLKDRNQSATRRVFDWLVTQGHINKYTITPLGRIVDFVTTIDSFGEAYFPDPTSDNYDFCLHQLITGLNATNKNSQAVCETVFSLLDGALLVIANKCRAEKELKHGFTFESHWGKSLAIESANEEAMKLALKMGYQLVIKRDPVSGHVRIKTFPAPHLDLTPFYEILLKRDPKATWFLHISTHMLLNGSAKNPLSVASALSIKQIIAIATQI